MMTSGRHGPVSAVVNTRGRYPLGVEPREADTGGDVVVEQIVADGLTQRLAEDRVGVLDRAALERTTSASALLEEVDEVQVELVGWARVRSMSKHSSR